MPESLVTRELDKHRRFELLDLLRFLAALMVVAFHWFFNGISNGKVESIDFTALAPIALYGVYGVHLFFLISGFVIAESAHGKTAGQFVVSRGVRLFPAYWVAMASTTIIVNAWGDESMHVTPVQFLANLTMMPRLFGQRAVDGVYWTLTVELTFYLLVFLVLLLGLGRFLDIVFPTWALTMLTVTVIVPQASGLPYLDGYYAFFASGAIMASIRRRGFSPFRVLGLGAAAATSIVFVGRNIATFNEGHAFAVSPVAVFALIGAFYVIISLMWIPRMTKVSIPLSRSISDLTYPIYLLHAHIGYTLLGSLATQSTVWLIYPLLFAGLVVSAGLLHWGIEVKMRDIWFSGFKLLQAPVDWMQALLTPPGRLSKNAGGISV
ncbi:acyltransferase family protein [Paramicrobacterium agarici]|uniref:Peptidoglycan/LPS O-acetylase OafA/YrhL n=1 Tax=Paramicrobacterium agarici TaxID=630514 RepID=A0A2A9DVP3_9MICO|nr:acyltransferase [Microbacterium agarici]PFG30673.1 peptidoglycan/LPS O-acetylase OafA/YrhL [Microbacterium agarici]